ncbi:hypothetical protein BGY98DRAFT_1089567 [Russula aff. rugulosa BPL654]|nr:hypothetical protein BGY98DRAFT_1089567 [Russula aff. rugulosa BPL654]
MGLLTWFRKKEPEDIGQVLAALASDIQKRETQLNEIRLRERRATLLVTLYTFAGWGAYLGLWYAQLLPQMSGHRPNSKVEKAVKGFPAILGPIIILFTRRIVQLWYNRKGNAEEKSLAALKQARRNKVEDFKKRTNYYETRELLERYEDSPSTGRQLARTYHRSRSLTYIYTESSFAETPQQPLPPPRKLWYDKLADALLGDDESSVNPAAARYALICQKCFAHNGLVKEEMWADAQYVCPKCGYFNPSARSQPSQRPESREASPQSAPRPPRKIDGSPESGGSTAETDS